MRIGYIHDYKVHNEPDWGPHQDFHFTWSGDLRSLLEGGGGGYKTQSYNTAVQQALS